MQVSTIEFIKQGKIQSLTVQDSHQSLLTILREQMRCTGTKEGCAEGDCGACTVVLAELEQGQDDTPAKVQYKAVNSCIQPAAALHGKAIWSIEDLASDPLIQKSATHSHHVSNKTIPLHPVQEAMVECHASQCGFCTPGFVMSLFARYQHQRLDQNSPTASTVASIQATLSGNLCRCTGYQAIQQAAEKVDASYHEAHPTLGTVNETNLAVLLENLQAKIKSQASQSQKYNSQPAPYLLPQNLFSLLSLRQQFPNAQLIAGATDVGLWINKRMMRFEQILDLSQVHELKKIEIYEHHIAIGAGVNLNQSFAALTQQRPQLQAFFDRFAGHPVRNAGTLGGNIGNGSPIGDSMPVLIALGANLILSRVNGRKIEHREIPLDQFYTGYRTTILNADEIITWIKVPAPLPGKIMQAYKISKRQEDDISAVCLAIELEVQHQIIVKASIGAGGVAATPARALKTQAFLTGQTWSLETLEKAAEVLQNEFQPISDMRASSAYRKHVLGSLLKRFWLAEQGETMSSIAEL